MSMFLFLSLLLVVGWRRVEAHSEIMFTPLECNSNLTSAQCISWSTKFGTQETTTTFEEEVVIECGECVVLDPLVDPTTPTTLTFNRGLNIIGRLLIPNVGQDTGNQLVLKTTSIVVQGMLSIYQGETAADAPSNKVHGNPNLEIRLLPSSDSDDYYLVPHSSNYDKCPSPEGCNVGKMPIVVAGGLLDIHAFPKDDCPTWTDLVEVATGGPPSPSDSDVPVAPSQPQQIILDDASNTDLSRWDTGDSISTLHQTDPTDASALLWVTGRTKSTQGPRVQLFPYSANQAAQEAQANVPYLLKAEIKVGRYNKKVARTIPYSKHFPPESDGSYFGIEAVVQVTSEEIHDVLTYNPSNGGIYLQFLGVPAPGYNIHLRLVSLKAAPLEAIPTPGAVCAPNVIVNGNFDKVEHHYPWIPRSGGSLKVVEEEENGSNKFLRHAGRTPVYPGLEQTLVTGCFSEVGVQYLFKIKTRIHSSIRKTLVVKWVLTLASGSTVYRELTRGVSQNLDDGWVETTKTFVVSEGSPAATIDYDDISIEFQQGVGQELIVQDPAVASCWGQGAQILLTPSTNQYMDSTVVQITHHIQTKWINGKQVGVIKFEGDPGFHPSVVCADPRMRSEVALLSRNVQIVAESDPSFPLHGGHLIVYHTPHLIQHLEGVLFDNMGQQGNLGRYPIHFHLSNAVNGAIVKSNTILNSNQRCIVIHGTHEVLIQSNIAYNTKGHCFMTEDGNEYDIVFQGNLGALTLPVEASNLLSPVDTDNKPATYWMPTPRNVLIGNVAAGSSDSGFWYEVEGFFRGASQMAPEVLDGSLVVPSRQEMGIFDRNKAHSNLGAGLKTYPSGGYKPPKEAIFSNFVTYRNRGAGVFSHNGLNQTFIGGLYADNQHIGVDIDRSYQGRIENAEVIGFSEEYLSIISTPGATASLSELSPCGFQNMVHRGIQIHAAKMGGVSNIGYQIFNVTFENYGPSSGCVDSAALDVDSRENSGYFDPRTSGKSLHYSNVEEASRVNLCDTKAGGIDYVAIQTDGGYIVSDNPLLTTLPTGCHSVPASGESCSEFCPDTCIRSLKIEVPAATTPQTTVLNVLDKLTFRSIRVSGEWDHHSHHVDATLYTKTSTYRLYLPIEGDYEMTFVDDSSPGTVIWPTYVSTKYEDTSPDGCEGTALNYIYDDSEVPPQCDELISNGDMSSSEDIGDWLHSGGGVHPMLDGSSSSSYFANKDRNSWANGLVQFVDTRCLDSGVQYNFTAKVSLFDENGNAVDCDASDRKCPFFRLISSAGPEGTTTAYKEFFGFSSWTVGEWNDVSATITVTEAEALKTKSFVWVYGSQHAWGLGLKDISMSRLPAIP